MWAVVPLVFWSIIILFSALDQGKPDAGAGLSLKLERRGVRLPGRLISLTEDEQGNLNIELGIAGDRDGNRGGPSEHVMPQTPDGVEVNYITETGEPGPDKRPPVITLQDNREEPLELFNGRLRVLISRNYVIRFNRQGVQISRKEPGFRKQDLLRELQQRRDEELNRREGPIRPGDGMAGPPRDGQRRPEPGMDEGQRPPGGDGPGGRAPGDGAGQNRRPPPGGDGQGNQPPPGADGNGRKPGDGASRPQPPADR